MGDKVSSSSSHHNLHYKMELSYLLDKAVIYRNLEPIAVINGESFRKVNEKGKYKVRLEFGWGGKRDLLTWDFDVKLENGKFASLEKKEWKYRMTAMLLITEPK